MWLREVAGMPTPSCFLRCLPGETAVPNPSPPPAVQAARVLIPACARACARTCARVDVCVH
eukprot:10488979-Alexandrium_andersonii.AAC.1